MTAELLVEFVTATLLMTWAEEVMDAARQAKKMMSFSSWSPLGTA